MSYQEYNEDDFNPRWIRRDRKKTRRMVVSGASVIDLERIKKEKALQIAKKLREEQDEKTTLAD